MCARVARTSPSGAARSGRTAAAPGGSGRGRRGRPTTQAVTKQPVVAIVPTGDEIRPVGTPLGQGDIVDSNSVMLAARAAQAGAWTAVSEVQPDDPAAIAAAVSRAAAVADLVLVLAGSSAGRDDYTAAVLGQVGAETVHGVAVRPGHPVLLGHARVEQTGQGEVSGGREVPRLRHAAVPEIGVPRVPARRGGDLRTVRRARAGCAARPPASWPWRRATGGA